MTLSSNTLDHIVIAAATLEEGAAYVESRLGVAPSPGGKHATQGTHNRLLKLGADRYLEVIAIDPEGKDPGRPRWFALDSEEMRVRLCHRPRLITWVARTSAVTELASRCPQLLGSVKDLARGPYRWRMCYRDDGHLVAAGLVPLIIQWDSDDHPTAAMVDSGCSLEALRGQHPAPARVRLTLDALGLAREIEVTGGESGHLAADVRCPLGVVTLD